MKRSRLAWTSVLLAMLLGLLIGCGIAQGPNNRDSQSTVDRLPTEFERLAEVWELLEAEHIDGTNLDAQAISNGAIRGMLEALDDPYTAFFDSEQYKIATQDLKGFFEGIGAEVGLREGKITILAPMPESPAEKSGIRPGDVILRIQGESAEGISLMEAVSRIRGKKGTTVELLILHLDNAEPVTILVVRGVIPLTSVRFMMLDDNIGHLRLFNFAATTNDDLLKALDTFNESGGTGIVVDLRNNPGGLLSSVVDVGSQFIEDGLVLYQIDAQGKRADWKVKSGGKAGDIPIVVLVNEFSASASEVFTGAMLDHRRATVGGVTTFGKGSVNNLWPLRDGSGVNFTIARWYTPNGTLIEGEGITPDIIVERGGDGEPDVQLARAIEILQEQITQGT